MIAIEETDEVLVGSVLTGNREHFAVLVDRYKRGIANFIAASVRSSADVADLTQETFLRAYAHLGTFNPELGKFSTWLYHIARNVVRTFLGKSLRRPPTTDFGEERTIETSLPDLSAEADPAGGVLRAEAEAEVRAALAELPERTRTVLALRYYDNMDYQTIATTMGLSLGNVKTLIHRGKLALAHKMRERFLDDELSAAARGAVIAHVDRCPSCSCILEELRVVDALMLRPRRVDLAPNFTFATMAEARALPPPAVYQAPLRAYLVSYLAAAWLLAGAACVFAPLTMRALAGTTVDLARNIANTFGGLGGGIVRFFGHDGNTLTAILGALLALDIVLVACFGFAMRYVRPRVMERLRS